RIVDMDEDTAADAEIAKGRDRAVLAGHAHMPHAPTGLAADPEPDHLVVAPQGPVEKHQRAASKPTAGLFGHPLRSGDKKKRFSRLPPQSPQAHRLPPNPQAPNLSPTFRKRGVPSRLGRRRRPRGRRAPPTLPVPSPRREEIRPAVRSPTPARRK